MAPLREIRRRKLMTAEGLAKASGVSARNLSRIENGETRPTIATIKRLQDVLEVNWEEVDEFKAAILGGAPAKEEDDRG